MEITEVRVNLRETGESRLKAYATITFDDAFVIRDLKIIDGKKGLFVAMPSRPLQESCSKCRHRNVIGSKYCNQCGTMLEEVTKAEDEHSLPARSNHRDIAHPITSEAREYIQNKVLSAYEDEKIAGASL